MMRYLILLAALLPLPALAQDVSYGDLPPLPQVEAALQSNVEVMTAETGIKVEQANQRRWEAGNHEFSLRMGGAQRHVRSSDLRLPEWDVALERPIRLPGKSGIDSSIGAEGVAHAQLAFEDARHHAGRVLLHLWFNWQRARAQTAQWQQQVDILAQQTTMTEKRLQAGDAPRMELNQARAALAQASVALQQARVRTEAAANELVRQFPELPLPPQVSLAEPQPIGHDLDYWRTRILNDNHELGMVQSETRIQHLLADRSRADRTADPTIGIRYASEIGGNERVTGVYVVVPFSFGMREAVAKGAAYRAEIAAEREAAVKRRLERDVLNTYNLGVGNFETWQQAHQAAIGIQQNADLIARAYGLGESSLSEVLAARRLALDAALTATVAQLDANEARYRLLLDAHLLWPAEEPGQASAPQ